MGKCKRLCKLNSSESIKVLKPKVPEKNGLIYENLNQSDFYKSTGRKQEHRSKNNDSDEWRESILHEESKLELFEVYLNDTSSLQLLSVGYPD